MWIQIISFNLVRSCYSEQLELLCQGFDDKDIRNNHTEKLIGATKKKHIGAKCTHSLTVTVADF